MITGKMYRLYHQMYVNFMFAFTLTSYWKFTEYILDKEKVIQRNISYYKITE